jgi:hypothetical protein
MRPRALGLLVALVLALAALPGIGRSQEAPAGTFAGGPVAIADIETALRAAPIDNLRAVGTSSVTLQAQLTGPIDGAFKPETEGQRRGWMNEVAAYRIARELGLDSVPPVAVRSVPRSEFVSRLDPTYAGDWDRVLSRLVFAGGAVRGSLSYWVPNLLRTTALEGEGMDVWTGWLAVDGAAPAGSEALARDLSDMVVFDLLIGNGDRASGDNMRTVETSTTRLVIRDHNLAFAARPGDEPLDRMLGMLRRAQRFRGELVRRLAALDAETVRRITRDEEVGPLLEEAQIAALLSRRDTALSWIGAVIEAHGEAAVLGLD